VLADQVLAVLEEQAARHAGVGAVAEVNEDVVARRVEIVVQVAVGIVVVQVGRRDRVEGLRRGPVAAGRGAVVHVPDALEAVDCHAPRDRVAGQGVVEGRRRVGVPRLRLEAEAAVGVE
jgi:hypothetical protein